MTDTKREMEYASVRDPKMALAITRFTDMLSGPLCAAESIVKAALHPDAKLISVIFVPNGAGVDEDAFMVGGYSEDHREDAAQILRDAADFVLDTDKAVSHQEVAKTAELAAADESTAH